MSELSSTLEQPRRMDICQIVIVPTGDK